MHKIETEKERLRKVYISVEFGSRFIAMPDGKQIKLQIWDTVSVYLFFFIFSVYLFTTTTKRLGKRVFEVLLKVIIEELLELYLVDWENYLICSCKSNFYYYSL